MKIDTTKLYGVRPIKIFNNCKVTDLDPLSTAVLPRLIAVQMPDADGATMHAMWSGFPNLAVNDYVRCIRDTGDTNILYVLGTGGATATSGGGAWPMPGVSIIGTTEYADFKTAIAAAAVGEEIRVGAGTDTSVDANQDVIGHHVVGSQSGSTVISVRATLTAALDLGAATYSDFEVLQTGNSASRLDTITLEANVILKNIKVTGTNAGAGVCRTIYVNDAGGFLINVHAEADEHAAFFDSTTGTTVVQGGYYKSSAAHAIEVNSGTVLLAGPVLDGSSGAIQETGGTVQGWYYDASGNLYVVNANTTGAKLISGLAENTSPASGDWLWLEETATAGSFKKVQVDNLTGGGVNLVKNYPSLELADGAQPEWWEEEDANVTLTEEDASGETIPQKHERVLKIVNGAAGGGKYIYQRYTHADEPLLDESVTVISAGCWVYTASAGTVTLELYDVGGTASLGTDTTTTTSSWVWLEVLNKTIGTTSTDLRIKHSANSATMYVARPVVNIGVRPIKWRPRRGRNIEKHQSAIVNSSDPGGAGYQDLDLSAYVSGLAFGAQLTTHYNNTTNTNQAVRLRRNGATSDGISNDAVRNVVTTAGVAAPGSKFVLLDDNQTLEWKSVAVASDTENVWISLAGYWEWES